MINLKNLIFFYSSFSSKSGRIEYGIYCLINVLMGYFALYLYSNVSLDNERILNIFYSCLILLITFVPMQAVTSRRLRDLNAKPTFFLFNFIPILNIVFVIFLLMAKRTTN
ncbi:uncharacterized membrane protein YhaH (DUF805 family) [Flavobacterium sp. 90]|uniref:DUF805 domain-containing protein n=1 Tax=Flavobacterium sp. 81 TaxID=2135621 RepID=UPI000EAB68AF|nr:uncharacterized membrane protein YhaH (DUF805 family) [Flavobacterium sp. 81]TCK56589.1 uncharacterized membrane protein YhaH (DUF805 family) [Flavobacterium sp. 90]